MAIIQLRRPSSYPHHPHLNPLFSFTIAIGLFLSTPFSTHPQRRPRLLRRALRPHPQLVLTLPLPSADLDHDPLTYTLLASARRHLPLLHG